MTILSVETSGTVCGVAVSVGTDNSPIHLASCVEILVPNSHDKSLSRITSVALQEANVTVENIDVVAVSAGPGSFTGLRIGAAFAKGLCFENKPRLLPIPTLLSLAYAASEVATVSKMESITVCIASHRDLVYVQTFTLACAPLSPLQLIPVESAKTTLLPNTIVVGPGASLLTNNPISGLSRCSPRFVALAASRLIEASSHEYVDSASFEPKYFQEFIPRG